MQADLPPTDPMAIAVVALLARQAHLDSSTLQDDVAADELGLSPLEIELALFEIEDHFDIDLPPRSPGAATWTVGELVQQVLQCCRTQRG